MAATGAPTGGPPMIDTAFDGGGVGIEEEEPLPAEPDMPPVDFAELQRQRIEKRQQRLKTLTVYERILADRDERMMEKHQRQLEFWDNHRKYMARRLQRSEHQLVVANAEEFREKRELFDLLERATPVELRSGGYSWYHSLRNDGSRHVQVGNMYSGLSYTLKLRKENYVDELVRTERLAEQGLERKQVHDGPQTWRDDEYLLARLRRYRNAMSELAPGRLDYDEMLVVEGKACKLHGEWDHEFDPFDETEVIAEHGDVKGLKEYAPYEPPQEKQKEGPHLLLYPTKLEFCTEKDATDVQTVRVLNQGSSVVWFRWERARPQAEFAESALSGDETKYFHMSELEGKLLPGQDLIVPIAFRSTTAGSFGDRWRLITTPRLVTELEELDLFGLCTEHDLLGPSRQRFEQRLRESQIEHHVHELVNDAFLEVRTPRMPPPDYDNPKVQEKFFEERNVADKLYWSPYVWTELHALLPKLAAFVARKRMDKAKQQQEEKAKKGGKVELPPPYTFEWDKSVAMLKAELHAVKQEALDPEWEELTRQVALLERHAKIRPQTKSPAWHPCYEAILSLVDALPEHVQKCAQDQGVPPRPFFHPGDEREEQVAQFEQERAQALEAAGKAAEAEALQAAEKAVYPLDLAKFVALDEAATEAEFRTQLLATAPDLEGTLQSAVDKLNAETDLGGMVVIYEVDFDLPSMAWDSDGIELNADAINEFKTRVAGVQDILDAGAQAVFVVGHLGAPGAVEPAQGVEDIWEDAQSPALSVPSFEPFFPTFQAMYKKASPKIGWVGAHDFVAEPVEGVRNEDVEGQLYFVENLQSFYEEVGCVRLTNGQVRKFPWAYREAWARRTWGCRPDAYVCDSLAAAREPTLVSTGLWAPHVLRLLGPFVQQEIEMLRENLGFVEEPKEESQEAEEGEEKADPGQLICYVGAEPGELVGPQPLRRKLDILRALCPRLTGRCCVGADLALYLVASLGVQCGLQVPAGMQAALLDYLEQVLDSGVQLYLPVDVHCAKLPPDDSGVTDQSGAPPPEAAPPATQATEPVEEEPEEERTKVFSLRGAIAQFQDPRTQAQQQKRPWRWDPSTGELALDGGGREQVDSWLESEPVEESADGVPPGWQVRDLGPSTISAWKELMRLSRGLVWVGTLGDCTEEDFAYGTTELLQYIDHRMNGESEEEEEEEDDEDEDEDEDEDDEEAAERRAARANRPPPVVRIPSVEFEHVVMCGQQLGLQAQPLLDTSSFAYFSLSEGVVDLLRGYSPPGLAALANKPPEDKEKKRMF